MGTARSAWSEAVHTLIRIIAAIKQHPMRFPAVAMQRFVDDVSLHLRSLSRLGIAPKPKHHFLIEMAARPFGS